MWKFKGDVHNKHKWKKTPVNIVPLNTQLANNDRS